MDEENDPAALAERLAIAPMNSPATDPARLRSLARTLLELVRSGRCRDLLDQDRPAQGKE